jgi:hypothetical protein
MTHRLKSAESLNKAPQHKKIRIEARTEKQSGDVDSVELSSDESDSNQDDDTLALSEMPPQRSKRGRSDSVHTPGTTTGDQPDTIWVHLMLAPGISTETVCQRLYALALVPNCALANLPKKQLKRRTIAVPVTTWEEVKTLDNETIIRAVHTASLSNPDATQ